jgi:hypothetical protein
MAPLCSLELMPQLYLSILPVGRVGYSVMVIHGQDKSDHGEAQGQPPYRMPELGVPPRRLASVWRPAPIPISPAFKSNLQKPLGLLYCLIAVRG